MNAPTTIPRIMDMIKAIERIEQVVGDIRFEAFASDWQSQWLVERGIEIVSEASRHLPIEIKTRHPDLPWRKIAGIGNILRHDYERIAAPVMWALVHENLPELVRVCREELDAARRVDLGRNER
jgi:uncharacterized protein with HEPN domain